MKRAVAAAISRLTFWASSIRTVNSDERKPRHQSSVGGASASVDLPAAYRSGTSRAGSGKSLVRRQPAELATKHNIASHFAVRPAQRMVASRLPTEAVDNGLTSDLRRAKAGLRLLRGPPDRFANDAWGPRVQNVHRRDASCGTGGHTSRGFTARTVLFSFYPPANAGN